MSHHFLDIQPPSGKKRREPSVVLRYDSETNLSRKVRVLEHTRPHPSVSLVPKLLKITLAVFLVGTLGLTSFYIASILNFKKLVSTSAETLQKTFHEAGSALRVFETGEARESFATLREELEKIKRKADESGLDTFSALSARIVPEFKGASFAFGSLAEFSNSALTISENLDAIQEHGFRWMLNQQGTEFLNRLEHIYEELLHSKRLISILQDNNEVLNLPDFRDQYLSLGHLLDKGGEFVGSLFGLLSVPHEQHFLLFFQNTSEIRPGGGFVGSYADITMKRGSIEDIDVVGIYDPDGQLDLEVVPPKPLQAITTDWGARDANWFFDFPTSARKIIYFLEQSKIYQERAVTFNGAIALNVNIIEDLLDVVGPLELPDYNLTITRDNFLREVQREVETGADKAAGEPKRILKVMAPLFLERLSYLDEAQRTLLSKNIGKYITHKDVMVYFKDPVIQRNLVDFGIAGDVLRVPDDFRGEYLAVVNANIAGGKTDAYISQTIHFNSFINSDGLIDNTMTLERTHTGNTQKEWWYDTKNKNYVQLFTPLGSTLYDLEGNTKRTISEPIDYKKKGYLIDKDLASFEDTTRPLSDLGVEQYEAFGKTVFPAWFYLDSGTTDSLVYRYTNPKKLLLRNETPYVFIFERQSGVDTSLEVLLEAPPRYVWKETGDARFVEVFENPPARVQINLTLVPVSGS